MRILDASNRFYTLIPHDFGLRSPPLLDKTEMIKVRTLLCFYCFSSLIINTIDFK